MDPMFLHLDCSKADFGIPIDCSKPRCGTQIDLSGAKCEIFAR
jgi:hypothetical protein